MNPYDELDRTLDDIRATTSRNDKVDLLKGMSFGAKELFKQFARRALSPFETYGINPWKVNLREGKEYTLSEWKEQFHFLLDALALRQASAEQVGEFIQRSPEPMYDFTYRVLAKDFKAGLGVSTVNAAFPGLVPEFKVQLCNKYAGQDLLTPRLAQAKLDGFRCILMEGQAFSRRGKVLDWEAPNLDWSFMYDGELFAGDFSSSVSAARGKRNGHFYCFDMLPVEDFKMGHCEHTFAHRHRQVCETGLMMPQSYGWVTEPPLKQAIVDGYEGLILKHPDSYYDFRRTNSWLKVKKSVRVVTVEVVDLNEHEQGGKLGAFVTPQFKVGTGLTEQERVEYWDQDIVGSFIEVEYQDDGYFRFPVFRRLRLDL